MSNLTKNSLELSNYKSPFEILFKDNLAYADIDSLELKQKFLSDLFRDIETKENDAENSKGSLTWMSITCAITGAATLISAPILPVALPFLPMLFNAVLAGSTAAVIGGCLTKTKTEEVVIDKLKRYRIAFKSKSLLHWSCLWQITGNETFVDALYVASTGQIFEDKLLRKTDSWDAAVDYCAGMLRVLPMDLIGMINSVKSGNVSQQTLLQPSIEPAIQSQATVLQTTGSQATLLQTTDSIEPAIHSQQNQDKYQWVNQVLKMPFRVLTGDAGSGKSTLERFMISKLKEAGYHIVCINTETNPDIWRGVEVLTTANEINEFFAEFVSGIESRQQECRRLGIDEDDFLSEVASKRTGRNGRVAIFFMEANTFELCGVDADLWADVLKMCLTNIRKWGFTACLTAQSDNQTSISSKLKAMAMRYDAQPRIECIVKSDEITGEAVSSGRGYLRVKGKEDKNPKAIQLCLFPKTKDFRTDSEKLTGTNQDKTFDTTKVDNQEIFTEEIPQRSSVAKNQQNDSRENDFEFIFDMGNIARNHILQNEWTELNLEKLRTIHRFKEATGRGTFLKMAEVRVVARYLISTGFLIETSKENFRVMSLGN
jgi:hypothetical protein